MDILLWLVTGGVVGWLAYVVLGFNLSRGLLASLVIGAGGALIGGKLVTPMFAAAASEAAAFSFAGVFFAAVVATAFLAIGNILYNRWGV